MKEMNLSRPTLKVLEKKNWKIWVNKIGLA
jgi:hypothetical protein